MPRLRDILHPAYRRLETFVHPLRYLFVEITQRCNLRCRHCGSDCGREARPDELTAEEWCTFFAGLPRSFDRRRLVLIVTGGEPLCHPQLDRLLGALADAGLAWGMVTNGWALDAGALAELRRAGLRTITVSLDGMRTRHDWLRGRKGSFERAVLAIELLARADLPFFDVVTCVHPGNLDELDAVRQLLGRLGVPAWRLFSIFPKGRAREDAALRLDGAGFRQLLDFIAAARAAGEKPRVDFSCEGFLPPALDRAVRDEPFFCRAGISIGSVLCDGAIAACPNISRSLVQGNIRRDELASVWQQRFQPFRDRRWLRRGPCASCAHWSRCLGNSLHLYDEALGHTCLCTLELLGESPELPPDGPNPGAPPRR